MILLQIDTRNDNVCLTLTEKTTLSPVYYLFEVWTAENVHGKKYFLAPDASLYPASYNKFSMKAISTGTPDATNGEFLAATTDLWHYNVYEQASSTNLDPESTGGLVETGVIRVNIDRPETIEYSNNENVINYND